MHEPRIPAITEADIRDMLGNQTLERAVGYYRDGRVQSPVVEGQVLRARVRGSLPIPYEVTIDLRDDRYSATCTCPLRAACKHIGAVLLAWAERPGTFGRVEPQSAIELATRVEESGAPVRLPAALLSGPDVGEARRELFNALGGQTLASLRAMARARGISVKGTLKDSVVAQMVDLLSDPASIQAALADLDPAAWLALDVVDCLWLPRLGVTPTEVSQALARLSSTSLAADEPLRRLTELGLVLPSSGLDDGAGRLVCPRVLSPHLPPSRHLLAGYDGPAELLRVRPAGDGLAWPATLFATWQHLRDGTTRLRAAQPRSFAERTSPALAGWPADPVEIRALQRKPGWQYGVSTLSVPAFEPELDDPTLGRLRKLTGDDPVQADFAYHLLRGLGAIRLKSGTVEGNPDAILAFLRLGSAEQMAAIFGTWLGLNTWSELNLVLRSTGRIRLRRRILYTRFTVQGLFAELAQARQFVVRLLRRIETGRWISLPGLMHAVWSLNPEFLHARRAYALAEPIWWLEQGTTGQVLNVKDEADWCQGPGELLTRLLTGPLSWLGIVDLGYDGQGLSAFRLTPLGALLLGHPSSFAVEPARYPLQLSDGLDITVGAGQGDSSVHERLGRIAELVAAGGRGIRYRLTRRQAHSAFESGLTLGELLGWLQDHSELPLPQPVIDRLTTWWSSYARVRLYLDLSLIEFSDDYTLPEVLATTSLSQSIVHTISPRLVIIRSEDVPEVMGELIGRGYTPKLEEGAA